MQGAPERAAVSVRCAPQKSFLWLAGTVCTGVAPQASLAREKRRRKRRQQNEAEESVRARAGLDLRLWSGGVGAFAWMSARRRVRCSGPEASGKSSSRISLPPGSKRAAAHRESGVTEKGKCPKWPRQAQLGCHRRQRGLRQASRRVWQSASAQREQPRSGNTGCGRFLGARVWG